MSWAVSVQPDGFINALSPVVYGDIAPSINAQDNTIYNSVEKVFFESNWINTI